jgi:hypothetical protein
MPTAETSECSPGNCLAYAYCNQIKAASVGKVHARALDLINSYGKLCSAEEPGDLRQCAIVNGAPVVAAIRG